MTPEDLIKRLENNPDSASFDETMKVITHYYDYKPASFDNGTVHNQAGTNEGSCKIFAFCLLNKLTDEQTLACFGDYYRVDVLQHPDNDDHANIRQFMKTGFAGIHFDTNPLTDRKK